MLSYGTKYRPLRLKSALDSIKSLGFGLLFKVYFLFDVIFKSTLRRLINSQKHPGLVDISCADLESFVIRGCNFDKVFSR